MYSIHTTNPNFQIYTDAPKTETGIRLAIIHHNATLLFQLNIHDIIFTAKYVGLLKEIQTTLEIDNTKIDICTDSLSILFNLINSV